MHVRRQLYSDETVDTEKVTDNERTMGVGNEEKKESPIDGSSVSPGSLKVSIKRAGLKEAHTKTHRKLNVEEEPMKKEYPKRRRIDRLSYLESGGNLSTGKKPIENRAGSLETTTNQEGSISGSRNKNLDSPIDVLLLDGITREVRPVIPKLVLKRVKRKLGSKEFDTMEIVSPTKAELGMYYDDKEIKGDASDRGNSVEGKSTESEVERNDRVAVVEEEGMENRTRVREKLRQEVSVSSIDDTVFHVSENEKITVENYEFGDGYSMKKSEEEQIVPETSERRALRKKRRRISSESEGGEEEFTDTLQVYGSKFYPFDFYVSDSNC